MENKEQQQDFPRYPSIGGTFEDMGKDFKSSVPHVMLPTPGDKRKPNPNAKPFFTPKQGDFLDKLKKWGLILIIILVVGYAIYRILKGVLW